MKLTDKKQKFNDLRFKIYNLAAYYLNVNCSLLSLSRMKKISCLAVLLFCTFHYGSAQIGIGTTNPNSSTILHLESTDKGILIPRVSSSDIVSPANGLLIFETNDNAFEYNSGTPVAPVWTKINTGSSVYMGKFIITGTGSQTISGLPFQPSQIKFSAHANVESYNVNSDNGVGNNNNTFQNAFGTMVGFATNYGGTIAQQTIFVGGSGNSINDISRYASDTRVIGIRYTNNNGNNLGLTAAEVTAFTHDGFTINVTNHTENIVVIYEAYR